MEDEPRQKPDAPLAPRNYDGWSMADFEQHLAALKAEITRAEAAMIARKGSLAAAAAFFKTP